VSIGLIILLGALWLLVVFPILLMIFGSLDFLEAFAISIGVHATLLLLLIVAAFVIRYWGVKV
jgi:hypothetical protein